MSDKNTRLGIKPLKWINKALKEAETRNLIPFFAKDDEGNIVCYMYHKGNGFLLNAMYYKCEENPRTEDV